MLRIKKAFSLDDFEQGLDAIAQGESFLQLPHSLKTNAAGTEVALLQLIISWARANQIATLRLHSERDDALLQSKFAQTASGLTALIMADVVQSQSGETLSRFDLLSLAKDYIVAMAQQPLSILRKYDKSTFPFLCIDNSREYRRPQRLYIPGTDRIRERSDFASIIKGCASLLASSRRVGRLDMYDAAASLLYEAFQNTHDHAQTDYLGNVLRRSIRGFLIQFQYVRLDALTHASGKSVPLDSYFQSWTPDIASALHAQFLEIAIFDSGPGLACRWLARDRILVERVRQGDAIKEEFNAVMECLRKGGTTKSSNTSGNGLFRIIQVVRRAGGLIRIRTGNLSLVKTFKPSRSSALDSNFTLEDLASGGPATARRWAEGTTLSVLLPMNRTLSA